VSVAFDIRGLVDEPEMIRAELARRHLRDYVEFIWSILEPGREFIPNFHIDAICDHLQAIHDGHIRNLIINIPPRCMKSLTVSVAWPTWTWIDRPEVRWLCSSYALPLAIRDNVKARRVIDSGLYQRNFGDSFILTTDQNAKQRYENDKTGYRIATSVNGAATGEGGDIVVCDDPHNVRDGDSDVIRASAITWWDEVMTTRLNDPDIGAKVIVMQRVHEGDTSGHCLDKGTYEHLNLPMEYEGKCVVEIRHKCSQRVEVKSGGKVVDVIDAGTSIGYRDPRRVVNDLLWPDRVSAKSVREATNDLGEYAHAGQYQQRPSPRKGGMFKVDRMPVVDTPPSPILRTHRGWDKAGTFGGGCYTAGVKMGILENGQYIVLDVVREQLSAGTREDLIRSTAELDGVGTTISVEQEPGSGGKESAHATVRRLAGYVCHIDRVTGSKEERAKPYGIQTEHSNVFILRGDWNAEFVNEHRKFPNSTYKDQVDAGAQAFKFLSTDTPIQVFL